MVRRKARTVWEFGDFQTPDNLAVEATQVLQRVGLVPQTVIEPTCGRGAFLLAAIRAFPHAKRFIGVEINKSHLDYLKKRLSLEPAHSEVSLINADFFSLNWTDILSDLPQPVLVIGNPPWVTSSELSTLDSSNLPNKSNFQGRRGFDAITGKSNFDISEWMILQHLKWLKGRVGYVAVLCKTAVARKVLAQAWKHSEKLSSSQIYIVDAMKHFNASVEACFFVMGIGNPKSQDCYAYDSLGDTKPARRIGYRDSIVVADIDGYEKWRHIRGANAVYIWRSGIKHDCAKVFELDRIQGRFQNGYGEPANIEDTYLHPLYKSSDIGNGLDQKHRKYLLVTQRHVGEETAHIEQDAPKTWRYLQSHENSFSKRRSSIYKNRPRFSIFGVGEYAFAPWKVAISGFYKSLNFKCIGPFDGRPAVFDDTVYFLPCWSKDEAAFLRDILNSQPAREFLNSMIFWSDKRPITAELLRRLDLKALSAELGREAEYQVYAMQRETLRAASVAGQMSLGIAERAAHYKTVPNKTLNRARQRRRASEGTR